ncbi:hypothetical protein [Frankia canadensis]|nr:hypothetical protein [Frankia canadensis]
MLLEIAATPEETASLRDRMMRNRHSGAPESATPGESAAEPAVNREGVSARDLWEILTSSAVRCGGVVSGISAQPGRSIVTVRLDLLASADADALEADVCAVLGLRRDGIRWDRRTRGAAGPGSVCLRCGGVDDDHLDGCDATRK